MIVTGKILDRGTIRSGPWAACVLLAGCLALVGCGYRYYVPDAGMISDSLVMTPAEAEMLEKIQPKLPDTPLRPSDIPPPRPDVKLPEVGDKFFGTVTFSPELKTLTHAFVVKDFEKVMAVLDQIEASGPDQRMSYVISVLRVHTLIMTGRPDDAVAALPEHTRREVALFGNNMDAISRRAEERIWSGDLDGAIALESRIMRALDGWKVPTLFLWPPSNIMELVHAGQVHIRALVALQIAYLLKEDYPRALAWAEEAERRQLDNIGITNNLLYGLFVKPNYAMYIGHGMTLLSFAAAKAGYENDPKAGAPFFDLAQAYFDAVNFIDGELIVESAREYIAIKTGHAKKPTFRIGELPEPELRDDKVLARLLKTRPSGFKHREKIELPLPSPGSARLPAAGERSLDGFTVTPALDRAFSAYLKGDGEAALSALKDAESGAEDPLYAWYLSYLRVQVLIMMGRAADAETELMQTAKRETAAFGTNLNARTLRGEARMWSGDLDSAIADFAQVIEALGDWRLPTLWVFPPGHIPGVVALTRAHMRSYLGMAGAFMLKRDYQTALPWAEEAEKLFEEVFFVVHHQLYGKYSALDSDLYYGRGVNLGFLGAAKLGVTKDVAASEPYFDAANAYFDALGYAAGKVRVDAMHVRTLLDIGRADLAEPLAETAVALAVDKGLTDMIWQLEALRGEALLKLQMKPAAEKAYRRAQVAVEMVSGSLSSDSAKRRFGVGKDGITRQLVNFDVEKRDHAALFRDLEHGRARAFVDMLARRPVAAGREVELVAEISEIDKRIRRQRLLNAAPGGATPEGVKAETEALAQRAELVETLRSRDPEMADVLSIATRQLNDIQERLSPGDVLAYALPAEEEAIRFLVIRKDRAWVETAGLSPEKLSEHMASFRTDDPLRMADEQRAAAVEILAGLGLNGWRTENVLYVVPSGPLYFVPWGALDVNYPVVILPTGGWITRSPASITPSKPASVIGDPELGGSYPQLPGAREEAKTIGLLYNTRALVGTDATEKQLRQDVGSGVEVLHIAAHGTFDVANPLQSSIILTNGKTSTPLTAARLFEQPLTAKLVVLSACETGLGDAEAGDDFLGLARSFYIGGALSILNSLWPVYDKPTRLFMEEFHRNAVNGDYGRAWLKARDLLKANGMPPSVYGAFVLGGSPRG